MTINKFDIVNVVKKTRSRGFYDYAKASPGNSYLVVGSYTDPNYGTVKLFLVDETGEKDFYTTDSCVERTYNLNDLLKIKEDSIWRKAKIGWQNRTYIPIIVTNFYNSMGLPITKTRDENAILVANVRNAGKEKFWIGKQHLHDEDIHIAMSSSLMPDSSKSSQPSGAVSIRVPIWFAKKKGYFS